jgi:hypothetical protein
MFTRRRGPPSPLFVYLTISWVPHAFAVRANVGTPHRCHTVPDSACTIEHYFLQIQLKMVTQGVCDGSTTKDHGRVS